MADEPKLQRNLGGWLGGQLGETCWILIAGILTLPRDPGVGAVVLVLFVVPNLVGWRLWAARERRSPVAAARATIVVAGALGLSAVAVLERGGLWDAIQTGGGVSANSVYAIIVAVTAGLYLLFGRLRRGARARAAGATPRRLRTAPISVQ